uniref:SRCR domain-containing protein n=1 Tax=Erpetoichthys calabaricus TaxID=27687 RepID=A0A8C4SAN3_ERPCA
MPTLSNKVIQLRIWLNRAKDREVTQGGLRLANGGRCAGRVEVFYKGTWGTVCDNAWGLQNADVVCQQKGYGAAVSAPHNAAFGLGSGDILQDDVRCFGNEMAFSQCPFRGWRLHNLTHVLLTEEQKHYAHPNLFLGESQSGQVMEWSL